MSTLPGTSGGGTPVAGTRGPAAGRPRAARVRRVRGSVLRLARRRPAGLAAGAALLLPSAAVAVVDFPWESWFTDGLGLVALATGAALVVAALGGRRPDWVDPA